MVDFMAAVVAVLVLVLQTLALAQQVALALLSLHTLQPRALLICLTLRKALLQRIR
jgi:hypothetical protein